MANWLINQDVDLQCGAQAPQVWPNALMLLGDHQAHTWRVRVLEGGAAASLTGYTITGYFIRTDGSTVTIQGSIDGNTAIVTLAQACYAFEGELRAVLRMAKGDAVVTLSALIFRVRKELTDSIIDPGAVIPSLDALLAQINACNTATTSANTAAANANAATTAANTAEGNRATAETNRASAETTRKNAETARVTAETGRATAESNRVTVEAARVTAETGRETAEGNRATAEQGRVTAEQGRATAEGNRVTAEQGRVTAEQARETAEALRRSALGGLSFAVNPVDGGLDITYTY